MDSIAMKLRLPADKLVRLRKSLTSWHGKKVCKKRDLLSLIGSLSHACKVVNPGRSFLRRLINLSKLAKEPDHFIHLNREARSDIEWWFHFAAWWNGVSIAFQTSSQHCEVATVSDASSNCGCGASAARNGFSSSGQRYSKTLITIKELVPIVLAAAIWDSEWRGNLL